MITRAIKDAAPHLTPSLLFLLFLSSSCAYCPSVKDGSDDTVVGFHYRNSGQVAPMGLVKQGDEEKSLSYVSNPRPEMLTVSDGLQSAEPPGLCRAEHPTTQGDPVKTVSLTSSMVVKEEVNISLYHIHHI